MGVSNDGVLVTPNGRNLFKVPMKLACIIQKIQHWVAQKTWKWEIMRIPVEKLSIEFVCSKCLDTLLVPVTDLPTIGDPFCLRCGSEMDMGDEAVADIPAVKKHDDIQF